MASKTNIMRNELAKFLSFKIHIAKLSDVITSISTPVSLQWLKINLKKSATKLIRTVSAGNIEEMFVTKSFTVAHEVEAIL